MIRLVLFLAFAASAEPTNGWVCSINGKPARVDIWQPGCGNPARVTIQTARHGYVDLDSLLDVLAHPVDSIFVVEVRKKDSGTWSFDTFRTTRVRK